MLLSRNMQRPLKPGQGQVQLHSPIRVPMISKKLLPVASAPKTGQHSVSDVLRDEALAFFFDGSVTCAPTTGGVNNVCQYVNTPDGKRYILRIYNNGNNSPKVAFEHEILMQLGEQNLSFQVPQAKPAKNGKRHIPLSTGTEACVFEIIPGSLAKTTSPEEVGRATGELSAALAKVKVDIQSPVPPYYELFRVHHAIKGDREIFYREVATNPEFNSCRAAMDYLVAETQALEKKLAAFVSMGLPMQLIHGDLHYDNVMVIGDEVSGLLDFEFSAYDWRIMELAVALSKYVGESDPLRLCKEFVAGYAKHGELTAAEIEVLPDLINLRILSNAVYFVGRAIAGEDKLDSLTSRAGSYEKRVRWVNANREALVEAIKEMMLAKVAA